MPPTLSAAAAQRAAEQLVKIKSTSREYDVTMPISKAYIAKGADGKDKFMFDAIASSTVVDRMGDRVSSKCLASMATQAPDLTLWLNHSYEVPEDVAGSITSPTIKTANDAQQGPVEDLWVTCELDCANNDRVAMAYQQIKAGRKLGLSIGGFITDYSITDTPDGPVFTIEGMDLFEISLVGIPANQRAIVEQKTAVGLRKRLDKPTEAGRGRAQRLALERGANFSASASPAGAEGGAAAAPPTEGAPAAEPPASVEPPLAPQPPTAPIPGTASIDVVRRLLKTLMEPSAQNDPAGEWTLARSLFRKLVDDHTITAPMAVEILLQCELEGLRIVKSGKAISAATADKLDGVKGHITDAITHGVCDPVKKSLSEALDALDDIMPDDDDEDDDDDVDEQTSAIGQLETKRVAAEAELKNVMDAIIAGKKTVETLTLEKGFLELAIGEYQGFPLERKSRTFGGESAPSSTDPERRSMSVPELFRTRARR